jgi:hypothetical protein
MLSEKAFLEFLHRRLQIVHQEPDSAWMRRLERMARRAKGKSLNRSCIAAGRAGKTVVIAKP